MCHAATTALLPLSLAFYGPARRGVAGQRKQKEEMRMKATIEVTDRKEAECLRLGLADPATRALVKTIGALSELPRAAQRRVLEWVSNLIADEAGKP